MAESLINTQQNLEFEDEISHKDFCIFVMRYEESVMRDV